MLVVSGVAALTFVAMASQVAGDSKAARPDKWLNELFDLGSSATKSATLNAFLYIGDPLFAGFVALLLATLSAACGRLRIATLALTGPIAAGLTAATLKPLIGRTFDGGLAFPSGHTVLATAFSLIAALLLASQLRASGPINLLLALLAALAAATYAAMALVTLHVHYPTDAIGGLCVTLTVVPLVARLVDAAADRIVNTP